MERYPKMITPILINGVVMLEEDGETLEPVLIFYFGLRAALALAIKPKPKQVLRAGYRSQD